MKVWELIAELSKAPAGSEVSVAGEPDGWLNALEQVELTDDESVFLRGDGQATADCEGDD